MKIKYIFIVLLGFTAFSCSKISDLNVDPDKSPTANPEQLITASEAYLGWVIDGTWNGPSGMWGQYVTWGPGVAIGNIERYILDATDHDNDWNRCYSNILINLDIVIKNANKNHAGIAKILKAYVYQGLVDNFGDVPFSEAGKGLPEDGSIFSPKFDKASDIYPKLVTLIDEGIAELQTVGAEDVIYNGDVEKWTRFGNSLKLRILMRMSNVDPSVGTAVKDLVANGIFIEDASQIAAIPYTGVSGQENPMYARYESGVKNFYIASNTSVSLLLDSNDPRLTAIYGSPVNKPGSPVKGIAQGSIDSEPFTATKGDYSQYTAVMYAANNNVIMMSPWEVWFLRAEAAAKFGTNDSDEDAFKNAVKASFSYLGLDGESFATGLGYSSGLDIQAKLKLIGVQKWISMNGLQENEGWISARAFDTPENRMFTNNGVWQESAISVLGENTYPNSWLIPQSEISFNPNAPKQKTVLDRVFWDN